MSAKFQMRSRAGTRVWESADPMTECRFRSGRVSGGAIPVKDGFYQMKGGFNRLELPPEIWQGERGARFRLIVDLEMKTPGVWAFVVGDAQTGIEKGIRREQMLAIVTAARRKGKLQKPGCFWWEFFGKVWIRLVWLRPVLVRFYGLFRRK